MRIKECSYLLMKQRIRIGGLCLALSYVNQVAPLGLTYVVKGRGFISVSLFRTNFINLPCSPESQGLGKLQHCQLPPFFRLMMLIHCWATQRNYRSLMWGSGFEEIASWAFWLTLFLLNQLSQLLRSDDKCVALGILKEQHLTCKIEILT